MPRSCTVCTHSQRKAIEDALLVRKVAAQLENLPPKKLAYVQGRLDGKSKKQAALDAGFSQTMAEHAVDKIG